MSMKPILTVRAMLTVWFSSDDTYEYIRTLQLIYFPCYILMIKLKCLLSFVDIRINNNVYKMFGD